MTRMKRKAEAVRSASDQAEASAWMARMGELERQQKVIQAALDARIARATAAADAKAMLLTAEHERLGRGVQLWAEANRAALTSGGKRKTVKWPTGDFGWRASSPKVTLASVEAVMQELRDRNIQKFIRTKQEPNKDAMLAEPGLAALIPGVSISTGPEEFFIKPAKSPAVGGA